MARGIIQMKNIFRSEEVKFVERSCWSRSTGLIPPKKREEMCSEKPKRNKLFLNSLFKLSMNGHRPFAYVQCQRYSLQNAALWAQRQLKE